MELGILYAFHWYILCFIFCCLSFSVLLKLLIFLLYYILLFRSIEVNYVAYTLLIVCLVFKRMQNIFLIFFCSSVIFELSKDEPPHCFVSYMLSLAAVLFGIQHNYIFHHTFHVSFDLSMALLCSHPLLNRCLKDLRRHIFFYSISKILHHDEQTPPFLR